MKNSILALVLVFPLSAFAGAKNCENAQTQTELNICSAKMKGEALVALEQKITMICSQKKEVSDSTGGSIYPLLLNTCVTEKLEQITKSLK